MIIVFSSSFTLKDQKILVEKAIEDENQTDIDMLTAKALKKIFTMDLRKEFSRILRKKR